MKNLSLFVSAFALCASTSYAAINCGTLPTCESLGYTDTVTNCPGEVLKCPFDTAKGKCQRGPSVGDLKYSLNTANHNGWILCNGQSLDTTKYAALYGIIKSNYGMDGTKFRVPDYRGFFLRAFGAASVNKSLSSFGGSENNSLKDPQKEQLPNATGWFEFPNPFSHIAYDGNLITYSKGAVGHDSTGMSGGDLYRGGVGVNRFTFNISKANSIYGGSHVIPANYAANVFIYSGVVSPVSSSMVQYRCNTCGYVHEGSSAPTKCPTCSASSFTRM